MLKRVRPFLIALAGLMVFSPVTWAAEPLARIDGVEDPELRAAIARVLGEVENPARTRWRARERASDAAERARAYLRGEGYYGARVEARLDDNLSALIRINPGPRFAFSAITLAYTQPDGVPEPPADIRDRLQLEVDDPVRARAVLDARARVFTGLRNSGFPQAGEGEYDITVDHASASAQARFDFDTGPFVRMAEPRLVGGFLELRPDYIERLAPYQPGDPFSASILNEYAARLSALDAVAVADARLATKFAPEALTLRPVEVRAGPAPRHRITGSLSWSSDEGVGTLGAWSRRNLFGGAERLTLAGRVAQLERSFGAEVFAPHWAAYGQDLRLTTELAAERTDAFDQDVFRLEADLQRRFSRRWSASVGAGLQSGDIRDATGEQSLTTFITPLGAVYDGRDDVLDPASGFYVELEATPGWTTGDSDVRFVRSSAEARFYQPLSSRALLALRARSGVIVGASAERVPADLRFYAGGGGSVRGYAYQDLSPLVFSQASGALEPFGGRALLEAGAELRWRHSDRLGFVGFLDAGAAGDDTVPGLGELRYGAGFGVRYYPGFGPIRLDIATPLDPRERDDPVQLYISIGQAF